MSTSEAIIEITDANFADEVESGELGPLSALAAALNVTKEGASVAEQRALRSARAACRRLGRPARRTAPPARRRWTGTTRLPGSPVAPTRGTTAWRWGSDG